MPERVADSPDRPSNAVVALRHLAADPFVRIQVVLFAATALAYFLPIFSPDQLEWYSKRWFCVPFLLPPVGATLNAWRQTRGTGEHRFWLPILVACLGWLAALVAYGLIPETSWTPAWDAAINSLYLGYYIPMLLAFAHRPWEVDTDGGLRGERRLRAIGIGVFAIAWTLYAVVAPTLAASTADKRLVLGSLAFLVIDLAIVTRIVIVWRAAPSARWRWICGGFGVATLLLTATDFLNVGLSRGWLDWDPPSLTDLFWAIPGMALSAAIALRTLPVPDVIRPASTGLEQELRPIRVGIYLVLGGVSFPLIHNLLIILNLVPEADTRLQTAQLATSMAGLMALSGLAILAYRILEKQRTKMLHDRRALEAQFLQAQKMEAVGRLAGGVAHDFNNLLTAISGYTEFVLDSLPPDDVNRASLEQVQSAADRAAALTRQLLTFSRREIQKPERIDVNVVITNVENMLQRLIGEAFVIETDLDPSVGPVLADPTQIEQVLMNLTVNSRDAMPQGGGIVIATSERELGGDEAAAAGLHPGTYVQVSVTDTGVGIPSDILPYVFEPFFTTKSRDKGTGLGLATVYGIVSQVGGAVGIDSQPGDGTTVTVCLPRASGEATLASAPSTESAQAHGRGETVLVAEDEPAVLALTRNLLERGGYKVMAASNGADALAAATRHDGRIDLLLTDLIMPGMSGRVLAERLTADRPGLRVLFMTGYTDDVAVRHGLQDGTFSVLQKPFTQASLGSTVRAALDAPV